MLEGVIGFHVSFRRSFWITIAISWAVLGACGLFVSSHLSRSPLLWKFVGLAITISFVVLNVILLTQAPEIRYDLPSHALRTDDDAALRGKCSLLIQTGPTSNRGGSSCSLAGA